MLPKFQKDVELARLRALYAARARAVPELGPYPTLTTLLAALVGSRRADLATRCSVLSAVIAEHQRAPSPVWAAVVLHAFRGMLVNLSRSLVGVDDREEADARVVAGLLEALVRVRPARDPVRIPMYVRQETRRAVFGSLQRDARARQYWPADETEPERRDESADDPSHDEEAGSVEDDRDEVAVGEGPPDPLASARAALRVAPDSLVDPGTTEPLEDRVALMQPTPETVPDVYLLRAHAVRGGLRRLTDHLFEDESARERERIYRLLVRRAEKLLASRE